jgi:hypothetical protein
MFWAVKSGKPGGQSTPTSVMVSERPGVAFTMALQIYKKVRFVGQDNNMLNSFIGQCIYVLDGCTTACQVFQHLACDGFWILRDAFVC